MREIDELLKLLADGRRRQLLVALLRADPDAELEIPDDVFDGDSESLTIQLRHNHLPKLAEAGVIVWDRDAMRIARGPEFVEIEPLLTLLDDNADDLPGEWP